MDCEKVEKFFPLFPDFDYIYVFLPKSRARRITTEKLFLQLHEERKSVHRKSGQINTHSDPSHRGHDFSSASWSRNIQRSNILKHKGKRR